MLDKRLSPRKQESMPVLSVVSEIKWTEHQLEEVAMGRSAFESLPIQNSTESMDYNKFNAMVNP